MRHILATLLLIIFISCNENTETKSEPVIFVAPESNPSNFKNYDSSFLKIKIKNDNYEIMFLNKSSLINSINSLDIFLQKNKELLSQDKVIVSGFENIEKYKSFKDLLLKYGISKFKVTTE